MDKGLLFIILRAVCFAVYTLAFAKSGYNSSNVIIWFGLFGTAFFCALLALDKNFTFQKVEQFKFSYTVMALNGCMLASFPGFLIPKALDYILPSNQNMVFVFFALFTSVILQSIEDRTFPTFLTILSVVCGIIGTAFISNVLLMFDKSLFDWGRIFGVSLTMLAGAALATAFANIRRHQNVTPLWSCLWQVIGSFIWGALYWDPVAPKCSLQSTLLALTCFVFMSFTSFFAFSGSINKSVTITAVFVCQLLSPALCFVAEIFLFPDEILWTSCVGIGFNVVAVLIQLRVLRQREIRMQLNRKKDFNLPER